MFYYDGRHGNIDREWLKYKITIIDKLKVYRGRNKWFEILYDNSHHLNNTLSQSLTIIFSFPCFSQCLCVSLSLLHSPFFVLFDEQKQESTKEICVKKFTD